MRFGAIVIDPPVPYQMFAEKMSSRTAAGRYDLMTWDDLATLGPSINAVALPDACLFLWICPPLIPETLRMAEAWGWEYKTVAFTWLKTYRQAESFWLGMGKWSRANSEQVWLFTRGKPERRDKSIKQVIHTDSEAVVTNTGRHSQKPDQVQDRIERLVSGPYLELFARRYRQGWSCIGNELDGLDIRDSLRLVANNVPLPTRTWSLFDAPPREEVS